VYLLVATGIPLPTHGITKDLSEPFPCMHSQCGCRNAEQCWKSCCCHTLAERFAWAQQHNVRPPEYAVAEAQMAGLNFAWLRNQSRDGSWTAGSSCRSSSSGKASDCCRAAEECCDHKDQASCSNCGHRSAGKRADTVVGWRVLNCQGHSGMCLVAVPSLIQVRAEVNCSLPRIIWLGPPSSDVPSGVAAAPTPPPPESA
jgi:hypothetical protein